MSAWWLLATGIASGAVGALAGAWFYRRRTHRLWWENVEYLYNNPDYCAACHFHGGYEIAGEVWPWRRFRNPPKPHACPRQGGGVPYRSSRP